MSTVSLWLKPIFNKIIYLIINIDVYINKRPNLLQTSMDQTVASGTIKKKKKKNPKTLSFGWINDWLGLSWTNFPSFF